MRSPLHELPAPVRPCTDGAADPPQHPHDLSAPTHGTDRQPLADRTVHSPTRRTSWSATAIPSDGPSATAQVSATIDAILAREIGLDISTIGPDTHLANELSLDSLAMVEVAMVIEDELAISVPDDGIIALETLGDLHVLVATQLDRSRQR